MALPKFLFFLGPVNDILFGAFWWIFLMLVVLFFPFLRVWWWIFFPLFLSIELRTLYLWWIQWDFAYADQKWAVLEIIPPKEILVPLKAMEDVFTTMWAPLYNVANWRERWCEGALDYAPGWMSWEITSIEGKLHFYVRVPIEHKKTLETVLYNHYPELEITEVADYAKNVPQNIPNKEWNAYGEDFVLGRKPEAYPIRTYEKFFEPQGERISAEEKRIDPFSSLLELMSQLGPGEQFWLQFITMSVSPKEEPVFIDEAQKEIAKLTKRSVKHAKTFLEDMQEMLFHLVYGPKKEGSGEKATYKWLESTKTEEGDREMVLTPGEREALTEIENKIKKPFFKTNITGLYVAKRENFNSAHRTLTRSYFSHFQTINLNHLRFSTVTRPKTHYVFRKSIPLVRTRKLFRNYVLRFTPLFPDRKKEMSILNAEELATIYHFPMKVTGLVAPTMTRVESKKRGPPPNLPM